MSDRKASFKLPPTVIADRLQSQDARRSKALEDQKRKRALRVDSSRQLENFANMNLGGSSDDEIDVPSASEPISGLSQFLPMLEEEQTPLPAVPDAQPVPKKSRKNKKRKPKGKANKWADTCMYAELLEMAEDEVWGAVNSPDSLLKDGLPDDLETGWVAVAPVPKGKRCLAITHHTSGLAGVVPNTTLRSRLLGKALMPPFPSSLPPSTVLDCILPADWSTNGVLHVLDVLKWKGQEIADCEPAFRFWWRDTRIAELPLPSPPTISAASTSNRDPNNPQFYVFPFPTTFAPVPWHSDTSLANFASHIIPATLSIRTLTVHVPNPRSEHSETAMDTDGSTPYSFGGPPNLIPLEVHPASDGLLLYVSQATYESGISPLSSWIPRDAVRDEHRAEGSHWRDFDGIMGDMHSASPQSPLDLFERLVHRRLFRSKHISESEAMIDN